MKIPLLDALPAGERYVTRSRAAMVRLSHTIEDVLLHERLPARLYSGFQRLSLFLPERERYARLAARCERVVVWGIADVDVPAIPNVTVVPLAVDAPLARTWFVVASHPAYTSALVAADISGLPATEALRDFEGAWTFDPAAVSAVERVLGEPLGLECPALEPTREDLVAQLRHAEQAAAHLGRYLERSLVREREEFAARERLSRMIVHDLRGPLTYIGGVSELLNSGAYGDLTDGQQQMVGGLIKQAEEMNALVSGILEVYRLERGRIAPDVVRVDVGEVLAGLADVSGLGGRLDVVVAPGAGAVLADAALLGRVLGNLLTNARKYGEGRVCLTVARSEKDVVFTVTDEGIGFPEGVLSHVFEPLRQGTNASPSSGVGLGLAFVRLAVEAMGGRVRAANRQAGGAELTVELPGG